MTLVPLSRPLVLFFVAVSIGAGGCGDGAPSVSGSLSEGTVSGLVTLQGKPVSTGQVKFNPANSSRKDAPQRSAGIGPDGRYTIKTLIGDNTAVPVIPKIGRKGDLRRAQKSITVTSGDNTLDFDIPPFVAPPMP